MSDNTSNAQQCPEINARGLTVLFDHTSAGRQGLDFVFIHGLNGHPKNTWTHSTGFYWPWELRTHLSHSRVMTFGYNADVNSDLATNFMRIENVASALVNALANQRWRVDPTKRPLVFIGHSMGGLVAKTAAVTASRYMASQANDLDKLYSSIRGFVFFGVPHGGSPVLGMTRVWVLQKMAKAAFTEIPPKMKEALESGSDELVDLADRFRLLSIYVEYKLIMISFVEAKGTVGLGTRVVDEAAAATHYSKASPPEAIDADHIDMVKFKGAGDATFQNVSVNLQRIEAKLGETESKWDPRDLEHVYDSLAFTQMSERWEGIHDPHEKTFEWILSPEIACRAISPAVVGLSLLPDPESLTDPARSRSRLSTPRSSLQGQREQHMSNPFLKWLQTDDAPLFWISGKAASGKSTLMKYLNKKPDLVTILSDHYSKTNDHLIMASFFFYDQGKSALQKSREGLLRGLLHCLLKDRREMWAEVFDAKCRQIFRRYDDREQTLEERLSKPVVTWSWTDLRHVFDIFSAKKPSNIRVFLLIDGLDEFRLLDDPSDYLEYEDGDTSEQARRNIVAHRTIAEIFVKLSTLHGFKICLSGRPVQALEDTLSKFPRLKLEAFTHDDIRQFIEDRLAKHPRIPLLSEVKPSRTSGVIQKVFSKASGVFLWVRLVVEMLVTALEAGDGIEQLEDLIDKLSAGLYPLYSKMMDGVQSQYLQQGIVLFRCVLGARNPLTELTLSFSQEDSDNAITCKSGRLTEPMEKLKVDDIRRQLKSRCGGLLESGPNPALAIMQISEEHEAVWNSVSWARRPHAAIAPVVSFVHRTAIEYLQRSFLKSRADHTADFKLLVSCLLRIKLIGMTMHPWEIFHAVKDAVFYSKRIEQEAGWSPVKLLDAIEMSMRDIWAGAMSAGRPEDYNQDPGYGPEVEEVRKKQNVPVGAVVYGSSIWGPVFDDRLNSDDYDTMLTVAVQGELLLYLERKVVEHGPGILNRQGRPLLAYAVVPRSHRSLMDNFPTSDETPTAAYSSPHLIRWLIKHGASPNGTYLGRKIWHEALQNEIMRENTYELSNIDKPKIESFCTKSAEWAKTLSLLVDNGADVVSEIPRSSVLHAMSPLEYLWPYWVRYALNSEPIRELFVKVVRKAASEGAVGGAYEYVSASTLIAIDLEELKTILCIRNDRVRSAEDDLDKAVQAFQQQARQYLAVNPQWQVDNATSNLQTSLRAPSHSTSTRKPFGSIRKGFSKATSVIGRRELDSEPDI